MNIHGSGCTALTFIRLTAMQNKFYFFLELVDLNPRLAQTFHIYTWLGWLLVAFALPCLFALPAAAGERADPTVLVIGVRFDAPPFSSCDKGESGQWENCRGYSVALCRQIAERAIEEGLFCSVREEPVGVNDRFSLLQKGEIDMLCGASTVTLERMRIADFSLFTFLSGASVMYRETGGAEDARQKTGLAIGVLKDTTIEEEFRKIMFQFQGRQEVFDPQRLGVAQEVEVEDHYQGLNLLLDNKLDGYLADREILLALKHKAEVERDVHLQVSRDYFTVEPYAIGLRRGNWDLRYIADSVLSELFDWNRTDSNGLSIFNVLKQNFPGKRFSKSLEDMFRLQRLGMGTRLAGPLKKVQCDKGAQLPQ